MNTKRVRTRNAGVITTFLEMLSPSALRPGKPAPSPISFEALTLSDTSKDRLRSIHQRVGAPFGWRANWIDTNWIDTNWSVWESNPHRFYVIRADERDIGLLIFNFHENNEVEIRMFGLVPSYTGRGFGGDALTQAAELAWNIPSTSRVWLHTATVDHESALPNYLARGFVVYDTVPS
jgi:RimJ/RimL family protein N-acetyltransferase